MIIRNLANRSGFALVIDWDFHQRNKWFSAFTPYLVREIVNKFNPIIIRSQFDYNISKHKIRRVISLELGVPKIRFDTRIKCLKVLFHSDPHYKTSERDLYFFENEFDFVLSFYKYPFFYHNPDFPTERFIHFPWGVPDQYINRGELTYKNKGIVIFGGQKDDAYDIRNWCRNQNGIISYNNSGVENKKMTDNEYFNWLIEFDAIIAAGSSNPKYDLVTPKYFEIAGAGSLLLGQDCRDLPDLGFNSETALIFRQQDFNRKVDEYNEMKERSLKIRRAGRDLILEKHTLSRRIQLLRKLMYD